MQHARAQFELGKRQKDGATLREHLEAVERATGRRLPELEVPPLPREFEHVWGWFLDLHGARGGNGWSANPISFSEIQAWSGMSGVQPTPEEVRLIRQLDEAYLLTAQGDGND